MMARDPGALPVAADSHESPGFRFFRHEVALADQGRWFKLWVSCRGDPSLSILPISDFGRWCKFGAYTKEHGTDGTVTIEKPENPAVVHPLQVDFQVGSFDAVLEAILRFPNCVLSTGQITWPHGRQKEPQTDGVLITQVPGFELDNVRCCDTVSPVTNAHVTFFASWRNWARYQGDFSTDRVKRHREKKRKVKRSKKRREEKRREETCSSSLSPPVLASVLSPESGKEKASEGRTSETPTELMELWNEVGASTRRNGLPGFVLCKDLSPSRRTKATLRLHEADLLWHRQAITRLSKSTFACGGSPPTKDHPHPFRASFDWYIANDTNCLKIAEGKYDD